MTKVLYIIGSPNPAEYSSSRQVADFMIEELRRTIVDWAPGLKDKQVFWKRRTSIVKVDMLLMAG